MSSTALPGQRAGQRPLRAAVAAQRAIGRAVSDTDADSTVLILQVRGEWKRLEAGADGVERLVPYELDAKEVEG